MIGTVTELPAIHRNGSVSHLGPAEKPKAKVFIAIPIYGNVDVHFFQCCMRLQQEMLLNGVHGALKTHIGDSAVTRARNALTREFLESDCTHLLFIDSDLVFGVEQIKRIMSFDEPIVGGLYCKKSEGLPPQLVLNALLEDVPVQPNGLQQVRYVGTGFIRIAREVFEKMIDAYGDQISYTLDWDNSITEWDFWTMGVYKDSEGKKRWLSEDWYFNQRALDLGYKVFVDMAILCKHSGNALYPLSYQEEAIFPVKAPENFVYGADCGDTIKEVFGGEYDFGITFSKPPVILDIGGNCGAFAWWANEKWPGASITSFEPNPQNYEFLERNCRQIGAQAVNHAVGDTTLNRLFKGKRNSLTCSQHQNGEQSAESIPITVIDPGELPAADLIKIDTEGSELDILENLPKLPSHLLVEYHSQKNRQRIVDLLQGKMVMIGDKHCTDSNGILAYRKLEC